MVIVKHLYIIDDIYRNGIRTNRNIYEVDYHTYNHIRYSNHLISIHRVFQTKRARTYWLKKHTSDFLDDEIFFNK